MSISPPSIVWFREDLRLAGNPALSAAVAGGGPVICLYIRETGLQGARPTGGASKWWLDKSLWALAAGLTSRGGALVLRSGQASDVLAALIRETGAQSVFWNRRYSEPEKTHDADLQASLTAAGISVRSFNARLLMEPWQLKTGAGGYYRVFTPFWRALRATYVPSPHLPAPKEIRACETGSEDLDDWGLHPGAPDWSGVIGASWTPGEDGAHARLADFLDGPINGYAETRNRPDLDTSTSRLSPHLRFGEIGPAQIWRAVQAGVEAGRIDARGAEVFLSEIAWREFSHVLLNFNPELARTNYNPNFDRMPWRTDREALRAWQLGQTGYPIVDAGMRELWHTGWMHNRVRMIVASFLTKHLLLPWQAGESWFWDTLVDADPAANAASWQWTAGSCADAAPYFRVFNPITQGSKFDETGAYVRRWCPELARLPDKFLHAPFEAPEAILKSGNVELGKTYPKPIVDHPAARQRALDAYATTKKELGTA
ncbi:MAG: deoxyribodipyrimidine photo-lyase [Hyphomonas sp.]|uniref:cryptochrome/photolyase family protein n=1 Tax=Hyphomonas sp. TaxID=87 RepID=UPI0017B7A6CD|nr:deoxyribodipyrimidine photo-lyase [Hyphomonas sp.]MBA3069692.1 deoxyribodipyrimidine photo-lyase [Hyphomonas sp.]MBU4062533.1 DNA photolyase family protein [Alphaproteobacteria bacterium]MBU4163884.1 DNA photolyase family protein [Alphaproteobacteria bacterium]